MPLVRGVVCDMRIRRDGSVARHGDGWGAARMARHAHAAGPAVRHGHGQGEARLAVRHAQGGACLGMAVQHEQGETLSVGGWVLVVQSHALV